MLQEAQVQVASGPRLMVSAASAKAAASVRCGSGAVPLRERPMAKRGRPRGATSWSRNPNRVAAQHAQVLMELWLAGAPVLEIRVILLSLAGNPEQQAMIEECWSEVGNNRRYTVPPRIKQILCGLAMAHVVELRRD